jgi:hypothetical protein
MIATRDYALSGPSCPIGIRAGYEEILIQSKRGTIGLQILTDKFQLCSPLTQDYVIDLIYFLNNGWGFFFLSFLFLFIIHSFFILHSSFFILHSFFSPSLIYG